MRGSSTSGHPARRAIPSLPGSVKLATASRSATPLFLGEQDAVLDESHEQRATLRRVGPMGRALLVDCVVARLEHGAVAVMDAAVDDEEFVAAAMAVQRADGAGLELQQVAPAAAQLGTFADRRPEEFREGLAVAQIGLPCDAAGVMNRA